MFVLLLALILDWYAGDPDFVWSRVPHPTVLFGRVIEQFERLRFNALVVENTQDNPDNGDLLLGGALLVVLLVLCLLIAFLIHWLGAFLGPFWWLLDVLVVGVLVAQKSLRDHVARVADALQSDGLEGGRNAVSQIVGRDVSSLDESGVVKAGLESLAENYSDGVVAPVFWYALFGLPGILFYKAVNTADSMVGHRIEKYEFFGKPAALLDDALNWPAARLSAVLITGVVLVRQGLSRARNVWDVTLRDAPLHRSPNAGWPEAAMAAALGVSLGGPRVYGSETVSATPINASGRIELLRSDIGSGLFVFRWACFSLIGLCGFLWLLG